jgi:hypothetical protein
MIKERIRTEEQNQRHRKLVEDNRQQKLQKCQTQQEENGSVCNLICFCSKLQKIKIYFLIGN